MRTRRRLLIGVLAASIAATPLVVGVANAGTSDTAVVESPAAATTDDTTGFEDDPAVVTDPDDAVVDPNAPAAPVTKAPAPDATKQKLLADMAAKNGVTASSCPTTATEEVVGCVQIRKGDPADRSPRYAPSSVKGGTGAGLEDEMSINTFSRQNDSASDIPDPCWDSARDLGVWYQTRIDACQYNEYYVDAVKVVKGKQVVAGTQKVQQMSWVTPATRAPSARYDFNVEIYIPWQTGATATTGQQIKVQPTCYNCKAWDIDAWYPLSYGAKTVYLSRYRNVVPLEIGQKKASFGLQYISFQFYGYLPLAHTSVSTPDIRCDRIVLKTPGCIIEDGDGFFFIDIRRAKSREWASHVLDSQRGLADHWGWYGHGKVLTRNTNKKIRDKSNRVACKPPPPGQKPGQNCDEYPFASTHQGAGVVGKARTSSRNINAKHNSSGGGLTAAFYQRERILEGDRFWIIVYAS